MSDLWDKTQKDWIKNIWLNYKPNITTNDTLWSRVSEMFNTEAASIGRDLPVGADCILSPVPVPQPAPPPAAAPPDAPVKRVVCSPDLPVFPVVFDEAAVDSSTSPADPKVFQCSFCQKTFNQKNTYQNHIRSHGKEGEDPYQCNYCGKTFAVPARLTRHYRTHTGEKPYQCEYCKKSFSVKENLSVHRRIHTKERPYKCDICERAFEHSGKLHRHMRIHTGERPHKCGICSKTFIQSGQLVIHMRTHTGEKPYVCKNCGKGFTCSKQLKVHNRTHTGEKPYSCDICGKSFGYNHVLKLHQVAHYGEKVYKCNICNETFTSKKTMEVHIKKHSEPATTTIPISPTTSTNTTTTVVVRNEERSPDINAGESSCASSTSDKENKSELDSISSISSSNNSSASSASVCNNINNNYSGISRVPDQSQPHPNIKELCHYLYPRTYGFNNSTNNNNNNNNNINNHGNNNTVLTHQQQQQSSSGLNPALLAAAAAAAASEEPNVERQRLHQPENISVSPTTSSSDSSPIHIIDTSSLTVTEPSVYIIPDPLASLQRRSPCHYDQLPPPPEYLQGQPVLINLPISNAKTDEEPLLTPPSSNPVSPVPPTSPYPLELVAINHREALILPPRKRSKMILKSMESEVPAVRYSSVIHYAKAS